MVLALKGFTPHTGSVGFTSPRTTGWILATPLVFKLLVSGVPLQDLSFTVSISRSIVQPLALISANLAVHPCQMTPLGPGSFSIHQGCKYPQTYSILDLSLVLSPYKLICEISLKYLTLRPVFLVALTPGRKPYSGACPGQFALDVAYEPDRSISHCFLPEFLAKNQSPGNPSPVIHV